MKNTKIKILIGIFSTIIVSSCQNDTNSFDNFNYTATYFGWQYPVRTLVLGESLYYDNTNDLNHQFEINASMGGVYKNTKNINVGFEIDNGLADSLAVKIGNDTVRMKILPTNYYEPITATSIIIPVGSFNGGIKIQLTDAFFNDPLACTNKYVLALRIKSADTDSILKGIASSSALVSKIPSIAANWGIDPRVSANWSVKPKNYTIYAIKYVNKFHGVYLRRGVQQDVSVGVSAPALGYGWEKNYIEYTSFLPKLTTVSMSKLLYSDKLALAAVNFKALIEVSSNNSVTISKDPTSTTNIVGTGKYVVGLEQWGGKKRNAFYLDYTVTNPADSKTYSVKDTLVIRDNAVAVEEFSPIILR